MAGAKRGQHEVEGPSGVAPWMVTFSDCMTLLLCFFVLLTTFSSFDEQALQKLEGAFRTPGMDSIFEDRSVRDSAVIPTPRQEDHTPAGSRLPDHEEPKLVRNPRPPLKVLDEDAFRDKQVFYVPVRKLFWGNGVRLTSDGRSFLDMLAKFMKAVPCRVIVAGRAGLPAGSGPSADQAIDQAWAIMNYFVSERKLPAERFNLSASHRSSPGRFDGQAVMEITLLTRDVLK